MLHSRPNYKEGMLQYVNDKEKAVELTSTLQVRVKANSIAFNENIHRKSEFVKQCYIRSPQDIYTQNNDQNAVKKEANMEGLEVKDGLAHEGEKRKPYFQLNAEMLLDSIKTEKAPFLAKNVETPTVTLMPQAIRSAATGRTFRGMNQILAQISLKEMGSRDTEIITYKQAKKFEAGIKKGSKGLHLTSYDAEGKKQTAYKYYPFSATYDRDNLPKIPEHTKNRTQSSSPMKRILRSTLASTVLQHHLEPSLSPRRRQWSPSGRGLLRILKSPFRKTVIQRFLSLETKRAKYAEKQ